MLGMVWFSFHLFPHNPRKKKKKCLSIRTKIQMHVDFIKQDCRFDHGIPWHWKNLLFCPERFPHGRFALGRGFHFLPPTGCWFLGRAATRGFLDGWGCWFGFLSRGFHLGWGLCFSPAGCRGFSWLGLGLSPFHRRGPTPCFRRRSLLHPVRKKGSTRSQWRRKCYPEQSCCRQFT